MPKRSVMNKRSNFYLILPIRSVFFPPTFGLRLRYSSARLSPYLFKIFIFCSLWIFFCIDFDVFKKKTFVRYMSCILMTAFLVPVNFRTWGECFRASPAPWDTELELSLVGPWPSQGRSQEDLQRRIGQRRSG